MKLERVQLREDNKNIFFDSYILDNSEEININKRPAIIVCPGGGYLGTSDREAEPVAMYFLSQGYNAFVLRYSTGNISKSVYPDALFDLAKTIMIIRETSDKWNIDSGKIVICGFSAGAHLTATLGVQWHEEFLSEKLNIDSELLKPNAMILGYPLLDYEIMKEKIEIDESANDLDKGIGMSKADFWRISNKTLMGSENPTNHQLMEYSPVNFISEKMPPTFLWNTANDDLVYVENSLVFAKRLSKFKIPYELHVFENGPHGLSLANELTASEEKHINEGCQIWTELAMKWLKRHI